MRAVRLCVTLAVLVTLACSGDKKGGEPVVPDAPFTPTDFCNALRDTQCLTLQGCYPGDPDLKGTGTVACYRDADLHQSFVDCMTIAVPARQGIAHKTMDWDEAGAQACLANLKNMCPGERLAALTASCSVRKFLKGKSLVGKPCYVGQNRYSSEIFSDCDAQEGWCQMQVGTCVSSCQSWALEGDPCGSAECNSAFCRIPDLTCTASGPGCKTCQPVTAGPCQTAADCSLGQACHAGACEAPAAGEPCAITTTGATFCAPPSVCVPSDADPTTGTCGDRMNPGAPCQATWQCKAGLVCGFDEKGAGACQEPLGENAPCFLPPAGSLTTSDPCISTARCQAGTTGPATCVPMVPLKKDCRTKADVAGPLDCAEGFCRTAPGNTNGICSPLLQKNNGCDVAGPDDCDPTQGLHCNSGQCEPPGKEGDGCRDLTDCETGNCTTGSSLRTCLPACTG